MFQLPQPPVFSTAVPRPRKLFPWRYLRFAWRVLQFAFVFLLAFMAFYVLERLVLVV